MAFSTGLFSKCSGCKRRRIKLIIWLNNDEKTQSASTAVLWFDLNFFNTALSKTFHFQRYGVRDVVWTLKHQDPCNLCHNEGTLIHIIFFHKSWWTKPTLKESFFYVNRIGVSFRVRLPTKNLGTNGTLVCLIFFFHELNCFWSQCQAKSIYVNKCLDTSVLF